MEDGIVLTMRGICKSFPGVKALSDVDFTLRKGEIHALMGENGAGKSTLIKVLTGVYEKDAGSIRIEGIPETEWEMRDVVFTTEESETLYGWMYYNDPKPSQWLDGVPKYQHVAVAMLHMTPDASQFIIWLAEDGRFSSHGATVILSPGMTLEYALEHDPYL